MLYLFQILSTVLQGGFFFVCLFSSISPISFLLLLIGYQQIYYFTFYFIF